MEQSKKKALLWGFLLVASYVIAWCCCFNIFLSYGDLTLLACVSSIVFIGIWCVVGFVYRANKKVLMTFIGMTSFMVLCTALAYTSMIDYNHVLYVGLLVGLSTLAPYAGLEYIKPIEWIHFVPFLQLIFFGLVYVIYSRRGCTKKQQIK